MPDGIKLDSFLRIGKGLYHIETKSNVNWFEANERCHAMDTELITFETMDEWNIINKYLHDNIVYDNIYWTSGNDLAKQFRHKWSSNGQPILLESIWATGEPNNYNNTNERCDQLQLRSSGKPGLNDHKCTSLRRFICEKRQLKTVSIVVW